MPKNIDKQREYFQHDYRACYDIDFQRYLLIQPDNVMEAYAVFFMLMELMNDLPEASFDNEPGSSDLKYILHYLFDMKEEKFMTYVSAMQICGLLKKRPDGRLYNERMRTHISFVNNKVSNYKNGNKEKNKKTSLPAENDDTQIKNGDFASE